MTATKSVAHKQNQLFFVYLFTIRVVPQSQMSQAASVVPPPPPPPETDSCHLTAGQHGNVAKMQLPNDECKWAADYADIQRGCFLSRVCQYAQPKECQYYEIASLLQVGPTCGLTALSMLLNGQPTAAELLENAAMQKYTINGEMFSAQYLYELTQKHLKSTLYEGILNCANIKEQLSAGCCLLVPYPFVFDKITLILIAFIFDDHIAAFMGSTVTACSAVTLIFLVFFSAKRENEPTLICFIFPSIC